MQKSASKSALTRRWDDRPQKIERTTWSRSKFITLNVLNPPQRSGEGPIAVLRGRRWSLLG